MSSDTQSGVARRRGPLSDAPLVRVLCQVRWPQLANFNLDETTQALARSLGGTYPLMSRQNEIQVVITPTGARQEPSGYVSRFATADEDSIVSVGSTFLALETTIYKGHADFVEHIRKALGALVESASIPHWNRLGYRYTNRIVGKTDLSRLEERFHPRVLGGATSSPPSHQLMHSITESVYRADSAFVLVRSAWVGPGKSIDPTLASVDENSWVLDIDAYYEAKSSSFIPDDIAAKAIELSSIAHEQFSSVVTDKFYERYG